MELDKDKTIYSLNVTNTEARHMLNSLSYYVTNLECLQHHGDFKKWFHSEQVNLQLIKMLGEIIGASVYERAFETASRFYEKSIKG